MGKGRFVGDPGGGHFGCQDKVKIDTDAKCVDAARGVAYVLALHGFAGYENVLC